MNRLKKAMALGMMSVMVVSSASFAESPQDPYVMTESMGSNLISGSNDTSQSDSLPIIFSQQAPSGPQVNARIPKTLFIFRTQIDLSTDSNNKGTSPETRKILKVNIIRKRGEKFLTPNHIKAEGEYKVETYVDQGFKTSLEKLPIDTPIGFPIFIKISDQSSNSVYYYQLVIALENEEVEGEVKTIFGKSIPDEVYNKDGYTKENRRVIQQEINTNLMPFKKEISVKDIERKNNQDTIIFYGTDSEYQKTTNESVVIPLAKKTGFYFTVSTQHGETIYYELIINNNDQGIQQPHTGGSSPQSSVRPDSSSSAADKKSGTKNDIKKDAKNDMKQDAKKMDEKKSDMKNVDQNKSSAESKVSTKLMIGETKYTVVVDGVAIEKTADVAPTVHMGRTLLPARMISEILGVTVKFESATKMASFMYGENNKVELTLGQKYMLVNGQKMELTADILNQDGRILLPLKDIQNAFTQLGLKSNISWDSASKSVNIEK